MKYVRLNTPFYTVKAPLPPSDLPQMADDILTLAVCPEGKSRPPILGQIDSKELTDTAVIVVRYWGGTLLGVPGLINAYKTSTALALQVTPIIQKQVEQKYHLQFDYTQMNDVMMILKQYNCTILAQEAQLFCSITTGIPNNRLEETLYRLKELRGVEVVRG